MTRSGRGRAFGCCGEILRGVRQDGEPFQVACPIALNTTVRVQATSARVTSIDGADRLQQAAIEYAIAQLHLPAQRLSVEQSTELDEDKGMAATAARCAASIIAVAQAWNHTPPSAQIAQLVAGVTPVSGAVLRGTVAVAERSGAVLQRWSWTPRFVVVCLAPAVSLAKPLTPDPATHGRDYERLLSQLDAALLDRDIAEVAHVATAAAEFNQQFLTNPHWRELLRHQRTLGALGTCVAHRGTVAGLLFADTADGRAGAEDAREQLARAAGAGARVLVTATPD